MLESITLQQRNSLSGVTNMTKIDETKEIVVGMTARDYYIDTRKLDYLYSQLKGKNVIFEESPKQFYANLGKRN